MPVPDQWSSLEQMAKANTGDPLFPKPLLVTRDEIAVGA